MPIKYRQDPRAVMCAPFIGSLTLNVTLYWKFNPQCHPLLDIILVSLYCTFQNPCTTFLYAHHIAVLLVKLLKYLQLSFVPDNVLHLKHSYLRFWIVATVCKTLLWEPSLKSPYLVILRLFFEALSKLSKLVSCKK